jgi:hypothetical protein
MKEDDSKWAIGRMLEIMVYWRFLLFGIANWNLLYLSLYIRKQSLSKDKSDAR